MEQIVWRELPQNRIPLRVPQLFVDPKISPYQRSQYAADFFAAMVEKIRRHRAIQSAAMLQGRQFVQPGKGLNEVLIAFGGSYQFEDKAVLHGPLLVFPAHPLHLMIEKITGLHIIEKCRFKITQIFDKALQAGDVRKVEAAQARAEFMDDRVIRLEIVIPFIVSRLNQPFKMRVQLAVGLSYDGVEIAVLGLEMFFEKAYVEVP